MDRIKITGINIKSPLGVNATAGNDAVEDSGESGPLFERDSLRSTVDPSVNAALFQVFRAGVLNTDLISEFIAENVKELGEPSAQTFEGNVTETLRRSIKPDGKFDSAMRKRLAGVPFDLAEDLKRRITLTESLPESVVILKMLFCLEEKDEVFNQLMIPYLEERSGLGNNESVQSNKRFYLRFLKSLDKSDFEELLLNLRLPEVIRADNLAYALLDVAEPKFILDTLEKHQVSFSLSEEEQLASMQKIQTMQLTILQNGTARAKLGDEALQYVQNLYMTSLSKKVSDDLEKLFSSNYADYAKVTFLKVLEGTKGDTSAENRNRRYIAVNHLVNAINNDLESVNFLKGFILKERDSFVLGNAVYLLAGNLGEPGKKALTEVIVNQVDNEVTSLPLAYLSLLYIGKGRDSHLNLVKNVFSAKYKDERALALAYKNLSDEYLSPMAEGNGDFLFVTDMKQDPEQVIDLIGAIGPKTFFQWCLIEDTENEALRSNAQGVLNYACEIEPERVYHLLSWTLTNEPPSEGDLVRKLAGMGQVGQRDQVIDSIVNDVLKN